MNSITPRLPLVKCISDVASGIVNVSADRPVGLPGHGAWHATACYRQIAIARDAAVKKTRRMDADTACLPLHASDDLRHCDPRV